MNSLPFTQLGDISCEEFLADYWQQKPLLIRNAISNFESPLSPDELAGLALEDEIESRIVQENHREGPWNLRSGPFSEEDFSALPDSHWTLLVQAVDQWVDEVSELLNRFRFLPNWRLDDIMVSYAADQGSVGPHFDYYDVFLLQGYGQRRWQLGQHCDANSPILQNCDLSILQDFQKEQEWVLNPGDMLYIPPQLAHHGVAQGECITYSIGFRAPSEADILGDIALDAASKLSNDKRFTDAGIALPDNPGEIDSAAIDKLQKLIETKLCDPDNIAAWFGSYMTQRKYPDLEISENEVEMGSSELQELLAAGDSLQRHPASRFAWHQARSGIVNLFVDGETFTCSKDFASLLCLQTQFQAPDFAQLCASELKLVCHMINSGSLYLD